MASNMYNQYTEAASSAGAVLGRSAFGRLILSVLQIKGKTFYHSEKTTKFCYVGIKRKSVTGNVIRDLEKEELRQVATKVGFMLVETVGTEMKFLKPTELQIDGMTVLKEVIIGDKICVKLGGKIVDLKSPSRILDNCGTVQELNNILRFVDSLQLCKGFECTEDYAGADIHKHVLTYREQSCAMYWSVQCTGFLNVLALRQHCMQCQMLKLRMQRSVKPKETNLQQHSDHTYSRSAVFHRTITVSDAPTSLGTSSTQSKIPLGHIENIASTSESIKDNISGSFSADSYSEYSSSEYTDGGGCSADDPTYTPTKHAPSSSTTDLQKVNGILSSIEALCPSLVTEKFKTFLMSELINAEKVKTQRRWDPG